MPASAKHYSATVDESQEHNAGSTDAGAMKLDASAKYDNGLDVVDQTAEYQELSSIANGRQKIVRSNTTYDRYIGHRVGAFALNTYEYNETRFLKYDLQTGGGAKYYLLHNAFWTLDAGVALLNLTRKSDAGVSDVNKLLSYRVKLDITYEKSSFYTVAFYQPSVVNGEYFWWTDTTLQIDLTPKLYLKTSFLYRFESRPLDPAVKRWDQEESTSLGLKL